MNHAVLIVDDEEHVLQSIRRLLRPDGYEIRVADGGAAALDILAKQDFAVIICDFHMPGMSGAEVLAEACRLRPDTARITFVAYTDLAAAQASINESHVNHVLLKPWDDEHLRSVVRDGARAHQMILDNRRLEEITCRQKEELEAWNHRLEQSLRDTLDVMVGMLEASNPNIGIHSKRVAEHALSLGALLNLTGDDLRDLEFAAHLHDIGRVSKLHTKKGPRSGRGSARSDRRPSLRQSDSGCAILSHVTGFEGIAHAVRHQYENCDGTGYPDRLKEDDIPLISRIIAIADSYDDAAFTLANPTAASRGAGKKVLLAGQGKRFDPSLVELFIEYLDREPDEECKDSEVELSPTQLKVGMRLSRPLQNSEGVLLLKSGTDLTADMIEHVKLAANIDPVLSGVFVRCTQEAPSVKPQEARKPKVLIVDDEIMLCHALQRELRNSGFDAVVTNSGHDALALIQRETFDLVMTDVNMPAMGGEELLQCLRELAPEMPCIVLTGNAKMDQVRRIAKASNVAGILVKPWDKSRLMHMLKTAMARRVTEPATTS